MDFGSRGQDILDGLVDILDEACRHWDFLIPNMIAFICHGKNDWIDIQYVCSDTPHGSENANDVISS